MRPATPLSRVRHIKRYREIIQVLARHGFAGAIGQARILDRVSLPLPIGRDAVEPQATPVHVRMAVEQLGPTFIKLGQLLSTRPDVLPSDYITELERLQDDVPPAPWEMICDRIESELEAPLSDIFEWVDERPLAAASLAQVHAGRLRDTGEEVAIKVQRPGIERIIEIDIEILYDLARLLDLYSPLSEAVDPVELVEEFSHAINLELNYIREGKNADRFRRNFRDVPYIHIPKIYWEYVSRRVLVMERIRGIKLDDVEAITTAGYNPHRLGIKAAELLVKQVLDDGFFHADPHPGNLRVMKGEIIGAMDFGQVGYLELRDRLLLAQLFVAAGRQDADRVVDGLITMGVMNYFVDRAPLRRDIVRLMHKYTGLPLSELRAADIFREVESVLFRHRLKVPTDLWLLIKTLVILEGIGIQLDPEFDIFSVSEPHIERLSRELINPQTWVSPALSVGQTWVNFLSQVPLDGRNIMRQIEEGKLSVQAELKGLDRILALVDRVVTRISITMLLAALVLGLGLLIPNVELLVPGIGPLINIILIGSFVFVSFLGLWLLVSLVRGGPSK
ncbi:MAG: AarF/ABC1/UbiB kinase family protein [Chloroflexi bacterium]|nr:AarF/ABC1/UbiB kinase family protein [Chloroflexota bacterium]